MPYCMIEPTCDFSGEVPQSFGVLQKKFFQPIRCLNACLINYSGSASGKIVTKLFSFRELCNAETYKATAAVQK